MEYLFFGCGIIYFLIAAFFILGTALLEFILMVVLSTYWSIKEIKEKK